MKRLFPFFLTILVLALGLCSCNNAGSEATTDTTESATTAGGGALPAFQIPADTAGVWMKRWIDERKDIVQVLNSAGKSADTTYLVYGFHLPRLELDSMLRYLGPDPNVWAMLAIKYDTKTRAFVPELVFAAEPNGPQADWSYYDFTAPCPNACPEDDLER